MWTGTMWCHCLHHITDYFPLGFNVILSIEQDIIFLSVCKFIIVIIYVVDLKQVSYQP